MRLAILVDVIAITTGIAVILVAADDGTNDSAKHCPGDRARAGADTRKNRACKGARARADRSTGRRACNLVIVR